MNLLVHKLRMNSLFMRMLVYFFTVMVLFSSFNLWSFTVYSKNVDNEIVAYNRAMIKNSVDGLENQFKIWRGLMLSLQFDERVQAIERQSLQDGKASLDYTMVANTIQNLQTMVSQPTYLFENVMILYKKAGFLLEKEALVDADRMFSQYYVNEMYPLSYWYRKDGLTSDLTPAPSRPFRVGISQALKTLMPVEMNLPNSTYSIIAMIDMEKWFKANHKIQGSLQFILHSNGTVMYQSEPNSEIIPSWTGNSDWFKDHGKYFFFEKGPATGFTYVTVIPTSQLNAKIIRMNEIALILFIVTVTLALLASWMFSQNIDRPVKRIMKAMKQSETDSFPSHIQEFSAIQDHFVGLLHEKNQISRKLMSSSSMLIQYSYIVRLKNLSLDSHQVGEMPVKEGNFQIVVYQLRFRQSVKSSFSSGQIAKRIRDMIGTVLLSQFPDSTTFQMEHDQLLSVIHNNNEQSDALRNCFQELKQIFDQDTQDYLVTIAISPLITSSEQFDQAYVEALRLVLQSRPLEETQILCDHLGSEDFVGFTMDQDQEFYVQLQTGNEMACHHLIDRALDEKLTLSTTSRQIYAFAEYVLVRTKKTMELLKIPMPQSLENYSQQILECVTLEQYKQLLKTAISEATRAVTLKREESYDLINYVMVFLENHYQEDISLDLLASKLSMSPSYLSVYIKENTGKNFIDHLNGIRLSKAKQLLLESTFTIQEIGEAIGYRNGTSFIRMFKKETGLPPGDYRKTMLRSNPQISH
ncbi:helix-turn-helix domain-containing protein [Paenibacillus sp. LMG 31460]|uniref:Helix-turn-helix domain-containing protein n=1 Tax=Paenibacillus germinis TaxID=2654979 RepID=A0ABX1Z3Y1_9BACL|nr:helix-turn-helix domain-containing protein [Paenibacillus germinis]NOU87882.1 helix-turn-helix domain-containing protein [Paenibacillus germinis]